MPVAMQSKVWVCSCLLVGIMGSNPARGVDVCLLRGLCFVSATDITRPKDSYTVGCIQCNREASIIRWARPTRGSGAMRGKKYLKIHISRNEINSLPHIPQDTTMDLYLRSLEY